MSDVEDSNFYSHNDANRHDDEEVEEEEEEEEYDTHTTSKHQTYDDEEGEGGGEGGGGGGGDDEDDEDEDDDDDEEEDAGRKRKKAKHRHKRSNMARFLDIEAEVSDATEEEDEEDDMDAEGFIEQADDMDDDTVGRGHHASLDARRQLEQEEQSPEEIAKNLSRRYAHRAAVRYTGDMNEIPQRLLMPSVQDANLWQVRVKPGRERDIVFSLMRKAIDVEFTAKPLNILAAFQRDSLPGMIYVEARSSKQVTEACAGLVGVYPSRGVQLVPIEEMASLLQIKKQEKTVAPGSWVRIRRGKYAGDLAQVMDVSENEEVGVRFIPRIDLNPKDDAVSDGAKKRKKPATTASMRPPQRLFNFEEVIKVYGRKAIALRNGQYVFQNETYKDGFIEKDFKIGTLSLEDVNPTLDEITQFSRREDGEGDNLVDLSIIAEASRKAAVSVLQPGDHIEVFEGEQSGVHGVVDEISQDVVTITATGVDIEGQKIELPARSVRKRFKPGDHVKVMTGQNADETGLVVSVTDNIVTFLSDMSMQEVSVFSKDLREAAEVGSGTNAVGNYELHDLVSLDAQTVGVIFKTERDTFRVLDQNGQVRLVQPHQISMRRDSNRAVATDRDGHEIRVNDNMKEAEGEGRKGRVLHIHQSFYAFLHNRDIAENGGVFVTRTRGLVSLAPKGTLVKPGADLSKMNPALIAPTGGMVGSGNMGRGPRDRHIGATVVIIKGPHKGYAGTIKDTNGNIARVELRTGNKLIMIDKEKIYRRLPDGKLEPLDKPGGGRGGGYGGGGGGRMSNPYGNPTAAGGYGAGGGAAAGGRTPFNNMGRTPNPYATNEGRTPAWNTSRTPNPYTDGGKTPAWNVNTRTPNPYANDGGKTPAWVASSRTPNPYAAGGGGGSSWGGATPGRPAGGSGWGGATPGRNFGGNEPSGWSPPQASNTGGWSPVEASNTPWSAPTPAAAPTPAVAATPAFASGPTPAPMHTPGPTARTPAYWAGQSAPTPFTSNYSYAINTSSAEYALDEDWMFESIVGSYLSRIKIVIQGTGTHNDGKAGYIRSTNRLPGNYEKEILVVFNDGTPEERIPPKYARPVEASSNGEEALAMDGPDEVKGRAVQLRANADSPMVEVSPLGDSSVFEVAKTALLSLYEEKR